MLYRQAYNDMKKFKFEKMGYVFEEYGVYASEALVSLKEKNPNHDIFKDCKNEVFTGFTVSPTE